MSIPNAVPSEEMLSGVTTSMASPSTVESSGCPRQDQTGRAPSSRFACRARPTGAETGWVACRTSLGRAKSGRSTRPRRLGGAKASCLACLRRAGRAKSGCFACLRRAGRAKSESLSATQTTESCQVGLTRVPNESEGGSGSVRVPKLSEPCQVELFSVPNTTEGCRGDSVHVPDRAQVAPRLSDRAPRPASGRGRRDKMCRSRSHAVPFARSTCQVTRIATLPA